MEAAKKADRAFGTPPPSTRHTATDASSDIKKITEHLLEKNATTEVMFITMLLKIPQKKDGRN